MNDFVRFCSSVCERFRCQCLLPGIILLREKQQSVTLHHGMRCKVVCSCRSRAHWKALMLTLGVKREAFNVLLCLKDLAVNEHFIVVVPQLQISHFIGHGHDWLSGMAGHRAKRLAVLT